MRSYFLTRDKTTKELMEFAGITWMVRVRQSWKCVHIGEVRCWQCPIRTPWKSVDKPRDSVAWDYQRIAGRTVGNRTG